MTLPPASTSPEAIRHLARLIRAGVAHGRSSRMASFRAAALPHLRDRYESTAAPVFRVHTRAGIKFQVGPKAVHTLECRYPEPTDSTLPVSWGARFYEVLSWPQVDPKPAQTRHPFRAFLDVERVGYKVTLGVHDGRDPWLGPERFKSRPAFFEFPLEPGFRLASFLVFKDRLRDLSISRQLVVFLSQRMLLTSDEDDECFNAFFVGKNPNLWTAHRKAYERTRARFVQPMGGVPSFPAYYQATFRACMCDENPGPDPASITGWGGIEATGPDLQADPFEHARDFRSLPEAASARERAIFRGNHAFEVEDDAVSMRYLRRAEPALHRALLDRIRGGKVVSEERNGVQYVRRVDVDAVDRDRIVNAAKLKPERFEGMRDAWINRLASPRLRRRSAQRKLKRWINTLKLSQEETEASVRARRLVRLPKG